MLCRTTEEAVTLAENEEEEKVEPWLRAPQPGGEIHRPILAIYAPMINTAPCIMFWACISITRASGRWLGPGN